MISDFFTKQLWFIVYEHHLGADVFPVQSEEPPTREQAIQVIGRHIDYAHDLDEQWIEVRGPCTPDVI